MADRFVRTLPFGAMTLGDGQVRFRLWAPRQPAVAVVLENDRVLPMHRADGGWFETTATCAAGSRYRYRLADGTEVPDPAARAQAGPCGGWYSCNCG